jgi:hypothetical protein
MTAFSVGEGESSGGSRVVVEMFLAGWARFWWGMRGGDHSG